MIFFAAIVTQNNEQLAETWVDRQFLANQEILRKGHLIKNKNCSKMWLFSCGK